MKINVPDYSNPLLMSAEKDYMQSIAYDEATIRGIHGLIEAIEMHAPKLNPKKDRLELARLQVELNDLKERALVLHRIIHDKKKHYEDVFLPQYTKKLADTEEHLNTLLDTARNLVSGQKSSQVDERELARYRRISKYLSEFDALPEEQRLDKHIRSNYYHVLSNLMPNEQ